MKTPNIQFKTTTPPVRNYRFALYATTVVTALLLLVAELFGQSETASTPELAGPPNGSTGTTSIPARSGAHIGVTLSANSDPVLVGDDLIYTATITNFGPEVAVDVNFNATLPTGTTLRGLSADSGSASVVTDSVTANLGTMAVGDARHVYMTAQITSTGSLTITSSASSSSTPDPQQSNNAAFYTTTAVSSVANSITLPTVTLTVSAPMFFLGRERAVFTAKSTKINPFPVTIRYLMSGTAHLGPFQVPGYYTLSGTPNQIIIPAGSSSGTVILGSKAFFYVIPFYSPPYATMTLEAGSGYNVGLPKAATVTLGYRL
jgi:uncharacterized repeat protein (TIGR01451 family)